MSRHVIPTFPLVVNVWRNSTGVNNPPDVVTMGQLFLHTQQPLLLINATTRVTFFSRSIYVPKGTDIRPTWITPGSDFVEVPAGSKRYYFVSDVDDVAKGQANEFRVAAINWSLTAPGAVGPWPLPIP